MAVRPLVLMLLAGLAATATQAQATPQASAALSMCTDADKRAASERGEVLRRAQDLSQNAVATAPKDPEAHLAVSCALGKRARDEGLSLSALDLAKQALEEVDTALALDPSYVPAIVAKGVMLIEAPGIIGGDRDAGVDLLRQALAREPSNALARDYLKRVSADRDDDEPATVLARGR